MDAGGGGGLPGEGGSIKTKRGECFQGGLTLSFSASGSNTKSK